MSLYHGAAGIDHLDRLAMGSSPVHRLHPGVKIFITLVYLVTVISFPSRNISGLIPFLFYPAVLMSLSGTPWRSILARLRAALPFSLMGGLSSLFFLRETVFYLGAFPVSLGLVFFLSIMLKTLLTVLAVLILMATTAFTDISRQLAAMGTPDILCLQLTLTYRYLSVLIHEAAVMFTAYMLRAPGRHGINMRDMGSFLGTLLLRSFDRAERVYQAMRCRGFTGIYRGSQNRGLRPGDYGYAAALAAVIVGLRFFNLSLFLGRLIRIG